MKDVVKRRMVVALQIFALEVTDASGRAERKTKVIFDVRGLGLGPHMSVVALVHALHGFRFRMRRRSSDRGEYKDTGTVKTGGKVIDLFYFYFIII